MNVPSQVKPNSILPAANFSTNMSMHCDNIDCKAQYKDFAKGFFANLGISSLSCFRVNALKLGSYFSCDQTDLLSLWITTPEVDHIYGEVAMQRSKENLCGVRKNKERLGSWAG